jgi:uncharacterized protein YkwD
MTAIETQEGPFAYVEAIEFLKTQPAVSPLLWSKELECAASDHVKDVGATGQMSSIGQGKSQNTLRYRWLITN